MRKSQEALSRTSKVDVSELFELIPSELMEQLIEEMGVDKWVKKLKAKSLFKLILFSLSSSERLSLRIMEDNFRDPLFQALAPELVEEKVTWVGIRDRLMKLNVDFCHKLFEAVYQKAEEVYGGKHLGPYHIKRYDSTMIATFSHLLEGMKVGNTKNGKTQVKLTTEFKDRFLLKVKFHKDQPYLGEDLALGESILESEPNPDTILLFDKGLKSRKIFKQLDQRASRFVGALNTNARYELVCPYWEDDGLCDTEELEFIQDSVVYLYEGGRKLMDRKLRLIQYRIKKKDEILTLITNLWDIPPHTVAEIYRSRWDIEVLFRFMKQEMNLTHFVCNDLNAIQVMLYFTLINSMLILIYKQQNAIKSYKRAKIQFFKELFYSIILETLESPEGAENLKNSMKKFIQKE